MKLEVYCFEVYYTTVD